MVIPVRKKPKAAARQGDFEPLPAAPRAFEQVCAQIRRLIADGKLKEGDKLPAERDLAEQLQVSRGVVREALRTLEISGLIELRKGGSGGAFVITEQPRIVSQAFRDMVHLGTISLSELIEARQKFVVAAIELACERATDDDFDAMERNIARTEVEHRRPEASLNRRMDLAYEFYHLIGTASRNRVVMISLDTISSMLLHFFQPATAHQPPDLKVVQSRRRFLGHLRARNANKACKEMVTYLAALQNFILSLHAANAVQPRRRRAA